MTKLSAFIFALTCFAGVALCGTSPYELLLTNEIIAPDGYNRSAVLANKQFPGPLISANKNDYLTVEVVNHLTDSSMTQGTSIHWHGLFQHRTASMDGVAWVTQCPISPNATFQYNFNVGNQTGTYWYHSHITTQYCDGLRGPLVIYDDEDPLKYLYDVDDESTIITLGDWFHEVSPVAHSHLANPDSYVINGLGRYPGGPSSPLATVNVAEGLRYRLRVVNTACLAGFNFSIDGHSLTVIEADGVETRPYTTDVVPLSVGQRVSLVLHANQSVDNYWIRAVPFVFGDTIANETGLNSAILRYKGAPSTDPQTTQTGTEVLKEQDLVSTGGLNYAGRTPDMFITLNITVDASGTHFLVNDNLYTPPPIPVLLQILNGSASTQSLMPTGSVITLERNQLISVTILGGSPAAPHPFHLHGHNFQVVQSAGSYAYNENGLTRDVVLTGSVIGDNTTFLFDTNNPGPWFLHCHIDWHLQDALAIVFAESPEDQISGPDSVETPKEWEELCPMWNALTTGKQYSIDEPLDLN